MPGFPPPHSKKNLLLKTKREIIKKDEDQSALEFSTSLPYWSEKGPTFIPPPSSSSLSEQEWAHLGFEAPPPFLSPLPASGSADGYDYETSPSFVVKNLDSLNSLRPFFLAILISCMARKCDVSPGFPFTTITPLIITKCTRW